MKKRLIALLLAVVLCIGLLPTAALAVQTDRVITSFDEADLVTGKVKEGGEGFQISCERITSTKATKTLGDFSYVVDQDATIEGDLIVGKSSLTRLMLCDGATLTVNGALILQCNRLYIYGQTGSNGVGKLIVKNSESAGAAVRNDGGSALYIYGGNVELNGGASKQITEDNTKLVSNGKITMGTLDGKELTLDAWSGVQALAGSKLVLKYCEHDNEDTEFVHDEGANTHHRHCDACGLDYGSESCNFNGGDTINAGADGHYRTCWCGNQESTPTGHTFVSVPTEDGKRHISGCQYCGYTSGDPESHKWDHATGKCTVCGFQPVATDDQNALYESVDEALKSGSDKIYLFSQKTALDPIRNSVTFNAPGKTVTLDMNGYTLESGGVPLTVEAGTLTITGAATIRQTGSSEEAIDPAIEVTGGKLIVKDALTAEGGGWSVYRQPAIKATGGELELNGDLNLCGGLTLLEDAKLNTPLTKGVFWAGNSETQIQRVDLWGDGTNKSKNHPTLSTILADGYVFVRSDINGNPVDTDGNITTEGHYSFCSPESFSIGGNATIVAHTHSYQQLTNEVAWYCHACECGKSETHTFVNGVCTVCSYACKHGNVHQEADNTFKCARCKMQMVAKSEKDGATTYYSILGTALAGAENGATVTLLTDLATWEVSRGGGIYGKEITLDLNGHSITTLNGYNIGGKSGGDGVQGAYLPATLKIVGEGNITPALIVVPGGKLDLSGWTGGTITNVSMSDRPVVGDNRAEPALIVGAGAGHIQSLEYNNWLIGAISQTTLSGGSYGKIVWMNYEYSEQPAFPTKAMLASGYAFKNSDGSYVLYTKTLEWNEAFTNVSVVQCPHGALTTDASGALRCAYCNADMSIFVVEITFKDGSIGYTSDPSDGSFNDEDVVKVKLLKDYNGVGDDITVNHAMTIDLNGHAMGGLTIAAAGVKIIDSGTTKGTIGTLTVTADGVTLNDLLESDYGFKSGSTWVAEDATSAANVTIAKAPIKDVYFYNGSQNNKITELTKTYGNECTLYAHYDSRKDVTNFSQAMYLVKDDGSLKPVDGGSTYALPLFDYAGTYTYRYTVSAEGYSKSADITVTVEPADIARAEVGLSGQGKVMFCPDANTGEGTEVTMSASVSFKGRTQDEGEDYTVSDNTGTNVGDYTLTITASPDSKKFAGTKKVSWKITPFTLGYFKLPWSIEKDYDGTTALPNKPRDWFTDGFENRTTLLPESSTIYLKAGNLYTYSATYVDANAGEGKEINATFQLTSDNYRFASDLTGVSADGKTLTLENWQNGYPKFNINKIDMPNFDKTVAATVVNDLAHTYEIALPALPALTAPHEYGTITYAVESKDLENGYKNATAQIVQDGEQYKLSLTVPAVKFAREESVGTITVKVTTTNYNDVTLTVNVNTTNKLQPTVTASADPNSFTYGTKLGDVKLTASATCNGHTVEGTIAWDDPADTLLDVGIYEKAWTFTPTDGSTYREVKGKLDIQVTKATLTGAPVFGKITENGKTLNDVQIDFDNILGVDGKQLVLGFDWTDDHSTVIEANKSYGWTIDAGSNYELLTGSAVLYPYSSGYSDQVKKQSEEYEAKKRGELPESDSRFTDVDERDYFFDAVEWAAENGITGGVSANRFGPALDCSRGQTMTFLWRAMGEPEPGSTDPALTDVKNGSYYYDAVLWAMQEGVTTGMGKNLFSPDATVTRGQFVTFLYRLSGAKNDAAHPFTDVPAGSYYEPAIAWAYSKGITTGTSKTTFNPDSPCTRAQIITFLYRYFNQK